MSNGDDPGLIEVFYHAIRLGCSEKLVERPGNELRIKRLVDDTEMVLKSVAAICRSHVLIMLGISRKSPMIPA